MRGAPTVTGLVEVEADAVTVQVNDVGRAGAVDVGQSNTLVVELVQLVEVWGAVHVDLRAEPSVAEVGPVTNLAVANAHQIRQTVAAEIGEED